MRISRGSPASCGGAFHSSSAVGSAIYRRLDDDWRLVQPFEWRLRGVDGRPATPEEQRDHLDRFGWVANTVVAGAPGETEFRIATRFMDDGEASFALGLLLQGDEPAVAGWPIGPEADGCTRRTTIAGPLTERLTFVTARWLRLALGTSGV